MTAQSRTGELEQRLARVRSRIRAASLPGSHPTLIVVTKYFPASDVGILAGLGVHDVGENKDQEAAAKAAQLSELGLNWHFVGQLQTNKAKSVARYATAVHSVDRPQLVAALSRAVAAEQERRAGQSLPERSALDCFLQVDLRADAGSVPSTRGGALPADLPALADAVEEASGLRLRGLMAVAPLGEDPQNAFGRLRALSEELRVRHPAATAVSAGMSADLEAALANGATHLRIGSDVLGARPPVR